MTYEQVLSVILSWLGRRVSVSVEDRASGSVALKATGVLTGATDAEGEGSEDERIALGIGRDPSAELVLERYAFSDAEGDSHWLEIGVGNSVLHMGPWTRSRLASSALKPDAPESAARVHKGLSHSSRRYQVATSPT